MKNLVFLGFNSFNTHKRGVENVVHFQYKASKFNMNYYLHWDTQTNVSRYENLICIGIKKHFFWFINLNIILFKLKRKNKFFIHSHNPLMSIVSIYKSDLFTVHDALFYLTGVNKHKFHYFFWILEKALYLRCNYVHFISEYSKKMSLYKSNRNFKIIYNTSHFDNYNNKYSSKSEPTAQFINNAFKIFIVRSIEERALINLIIDVAAKLKYDNVQFLIAGKGPMLDFYRFQIHNFGLQNVQLLGYVSDNHLIQYYKNCDLVLVPAAYGEGFGLPIIEGYLFDKPVIASNVCAIPEVIISSDFLFENNSDSLISRIEYVKKNVKLDYKEYYNSKFSNYTISSEISKLYKKLI